jgi:hypothetical protein
VGLKNGDGVGTNVDLRAEVLENGTVVSSGQLNGIPGGSSGFNNAKLNTVLLTLFASVEVSSGETFSLKRSVRNTCFGKTHNSGTARLSFNDSQANSRFGATIGDTPSDFCLRDGFALSTTPEAGPKKTIDVVVDNKTSYPRRPVQAVWHLEPGAAVEDKEHSHVGRP